MDGEAPRNLPRVLFLRVLFDKNMREQFKDHPLYDQTLEFIEKYDAPAFDPDAETYPLSFFEPMIQRVFEKPKQSLYKSEGLDDFPRLSSGGI